MLMILWEIYLPIYSFAINEYSLGKIEQHKIKPQMYNYFNIQINSDCFNIHIKCKYLNDLFLNFPKLYTNFIKVKITD